MKIWAVLAVIFAGACGSTIRKLEPRFGEKIIDGEMADIKDVPYQVALLSSGSYWCGGSIISKDWVLTAAHCSLGIPNKFLTVRVGSDIWSSGGSLHKVIKKIVHPKYNTEILYDYDYSVLRVETPFALGTPGIAAVSLASEDPSDGDMAIISGWGQSNRVLELKKVNLPVVDRQKCQEKYKPMVISPRMMCAGWPEGGRNTCYGDSGGALVVAGKQVGIVSWAKECAARGYPTVFGDVADQREWIRENTGV